MHGSLCVRPVEDIHALKRELQSLLGEVDQQLKEKEAVLEASKEFSETAGTLSEEEVLQGLDTRLLEALKNKRMSSLYELVEEVAPGVYCFPLFTDAFCDFMLESVNTAMNPEERGADDSLLKITGW